MHVTRLYFLLFSLIYIFQNYLSFAIYKPVAIVGNEIITESDLKNRINLSLLIKQQSKNTHINSSILRIMIDENIKKQTTKLFKIIPEESVILNVINIIAKQNNKNYFTLKSFLQKQGVSFNTFYEYIYTKIAWKYYLNKFYSNKIIINNEKLKTIENILTKEKFIPNFERLYKILYTYNKIILSIDEKFAFHELMKKIEKINFLQSNIKNIIFFKEKYNIFNNIIYIKKEIISQNEINSLIKDLIQTTNNKNMIRSKYFPKIGIIFLYLKAREEIYDHKFKKEKIRNMLINKQFNKLSQNLLNKLKFSTFIEIRG